MKGVNISGAIIPISESDSYATHIDNFGKGGIHSVSSLIQRDLITPERRTEGMLCYVVETQLMYTLIGGLGNEYWQEFSGFNTALELFLKDLEVDVVQLKRDFDRVDKLKQLDFNRLWIGNSNNEPIQKVNIGLVNMPQIGAALFPEPTGTLSIPLPNPTFNPISGFDWLMSGAWLPQIFAGSPGKVDPSIKDTIESSALAMTQIKTAQAIKRLDNASFIVKNKNLSFIWENPAMLAIPEAVKNLYDLKSTYTFQHAQALDELGVSEGQNGILRADHEGNLNATTAVTIDDTGNLEAEGLLVKNALGEKTGFVAPLVSDNSIYSLPAVEGFPTQVLAIEGPSIGGKIPTFWMTLPKRIRRKPRPPFTPIVPVPIWIGNPEPTPIPIPEKAPPVENSIPALDKAGGEIVDTPAQVNPSTGDISTTGSLNSGGSISSGSSTSIGSISSIGSSGSAGSGGTGGLGGIASSIGGLGGAAGAAGLGGLGGSAASTSIVGGAGGLGVAGGTIGGLGGAVVISGGLGGTGGSAGMPATGGLGSNITVGAGLGIGATGGALIIEGVKNAKRTGVIIAGGDEDDNSSIVIEDDEDSITIGGEAGSGNLALTGNVSAKGNLGARGLNLQELDNEHQVNIQPPMNLAASYSVILPSQEGKEGQVLTQGADNKWIWQDSAAGVQSITAGVGLDGGTITDTGTISLTDTTVTAGDYSNANITVDAQGRITAASNGSSGQGTVTSVGITSGSGISVSGSPITDSGIINLELENIPASKIESYPNDATKYLDGSGSWSVPSGGGGSGVTSVGITAGQGINVTGSPVTKSGSINLELGNIPVNKLSNWGRTDLFLRGDAKWARVPNPTYTFTGAISGSTQGTFNVNTTLNTRLNEVPYPTGNVSMAGQRLTALAVPSSDGDAVNKTYVVQLIEEVKRLIPTADKFYYGIFYSDFSDPITIDTPDTRINFQTNGDRSSLLIRQSGGLFEIDNENPHSKFRIFTKISIGEVASSWFDTLDLIWYGEDSTGYVRRIDGNYDFHTRESNTIISFYSYTNRSNIVKMWLQPETFGSYAFSIVIKNVWCTIESVL